MNILMVQCNIFQKILWKLYQLTICFSVYLLDDNKLTASICPKSISWPRRKIKSSLHTYFFFWYPSKVLSPWNNAWFKIYISERSILFITNFLHTLGNNSNFRKIVYLKFRPDISQLLVNSFYFGFFALAVSNVGNENCETTHSISPDGWHFDSTLLMRYDLKI